MKKTRWIAAALLAVVLAACQSFEVNKGSDRIGGTYSYHVGGYDWGSGVDRALLTLDHKISGISVKDLSVTETKQVTDWTDPSFPVSVVELERKITAAYLCDKEGNPVDKPSRYVAVELYVSPSEGSPFLYSMHTSRNTWSDPYRLTFSLSPEAAILSADIPVTSFSLAAEAAGYTTSADNFGTAAYETEEGTLYEYAFYEPKKKSDTLFVWLHGGGEGWTEGSDVLVPLLANKATAFAGDDFQNALGGVAVLVPQSPSFWMDSGSGEMTSDNTSMYTESLMELIDYYKGEYGAEKVVLAGCSNGGFMTLDLMMHYPDYFACGVPICEAKTDEFLTDEEIGILKDQPLFFIYSETDPIVPPAIYEIPTIERLKAAGAKNLRVFSPVEVVDTSGEYTGNDGGPYLYNGHWSWIYFYNNEALDDVTGQDAWSWIAEQLK